MQACLEQVLTEWVVQSPPLPDACWTCCRAPARRQGLLPCAFGPWCSGSGTARSVTAFRTEGNDSVNALTMI